MDITVGANLAQGLFWTGVAGISLLIAIAISATATWLAFTVSKRHRIKIADIFISQFTELWDDDQIAIIEQLIVIAYAKIKQRGYHSLYSDYANIYEKILKNQEEKRINEKW